MVDDIVTRAESVGSQVDSGAVEGPLEELSTEGLEQLQAESHTVIAGGLPEEEGAYQQSVQQTPSEIKEILKNGELQTFIDKTHSDREETVTFTCLMTASCPIAEQC